MVFAFAGDSTITRSLPSLVAMLADLRAQSKCLSGKWRHFAPGSIPFPYGEEKFQQPAEASPEEQTFLHKGALPTMPKTMDRCLDAPPGINHREPVQGHGIEEPFYIHAPESFAMMNLTPVLGLLGILAGWASCTTSPETGQLGHAPHVGNFWAPMELQRWYYADLDSTRSILEAGIRA